MTQWTRNIRKIIVLVFIGILLSGSGAAIYFMRVRSDNLKGKYPPTTCKTITATYLDTQGKRKTGTELSDSLLTWENQAVNSYSTNMAL